VNINMSLLEINDLRIRYRSTDNDVYAVNDVSFAIENGVNYGLVGESGCGKSTIAHSILGLLDDNAVIDSGTVEFEGQNLLEISEKEWQKIRWGRISYIPQSAMDSLDPVMTVGKQIRQAISVHQDVSTSEAETRVKEVLEIVGLEPSRSTDYPHQFSGGMRQRVTIAMALALEPDLIIADEPTTGLDVIVQDKIISKLIEIQESIKSSLLLITHDIGVVSETCQEVSILYGGKVMEQGGTRDVFKNPSNPYTMGLKNSFPDVEDTNRRAISIPGSLPELTNEPNSCVFNNRCPFATDECDRGHPPLAQVGDQRSACYHIDKVNRFRKVARQPEAWGLDFIETTHGQADGKIIMETNDLSKWYKQPQSITDQIRGREPDYLKAVDGVNLDIRENEILGIAGESGCGKSTLGEVLSLLQHRTGGNIRYNGDAIDQYLSGSSKAFRSKVQFIFQDPFDSLNPRQTVRAAISEPLKIQGRKREYINNAVRKTLIDVGLRPPEKYLDDYPHELSGGERQRVAIARALILKPELLICDEPASMLDVSLKASILNILRKLADERGIAILYISHDLASLSQICDRLAVMYLGRIVEIGDTRVIFQRPKHPYTASLLAASPKSDPTENRQRVLLPGEPPSPVSLPSGCNFAPRCPKASNDCWDVEPPRNTFENKGHEAACYYPVEDVSEEILAAYSK